MTTARRVHILVVLVALCLRDDNESITENVILLNKGIHAGLWQVVNKFEAAGAGGASQSNWMSF